MMADTPPPLPDFPISRGLKIREAAIIAAGGAATLAFGTQFEELGFVTSAFGILCCLPAFGVCLRDIYFWTLRRKALLRWSEAVPEQSPLQDFLSELQASPSGERGPSAKIWVLGWPQAPEPDAVFEDSLPAVARLGERWRRLGLLNEDQLYELRQRGLELNWSGYAPPGFEVAPEPVRQS